MRTKIIKYFLSILAFTSFSIAGFLTDVKTGFAVMGGLAIAYFIVYTMYMEWNIK